MNDEIKKRAAIERGLRSVRPVTLTRAEANSICETLIEMAVRLPLRYRNHGDALELLGYRPAVPPSVTPREETRHE